MINRELQVSQREKQEILAFEGHLAAASTRQTITESSSLLLSQLTSLEPQCVHSLGLDCVHHPPGGGGRKFRANVFLFPFVLSAPSEGLGT